MKMGLMAAATFAATILGAGASQAATVVPLVANGPAPVVELVAGGCGIGFHRGPLGGCRPNGIVVGPRVFVGGVYHPYGWHAYGWHRYGWRRW